MTESTLAYALDKAIDGVWPRAQLLRAVPDFP